MHAELGLSGSARPGVGASATREPQARVSGTTSRASDLAVPRAPAITWPAPFAPARCRHFRPAHWKRRRRRRRGGRGEEGAARVARRGGAPRAPRDLGRSAPPRPGVAGSPGRRGESRGRCRRGVRTWRQPGGASLAGPPAGKRRSHAVPGSLRALPASGPRRPAPSAAPGSLLLPCPARIPFVQVQWLQGLAALGPQGGRDGGRKCRAPVDSSSPGPRVVVLDR